MTVALIDDGGVIASSTVTSLEAGASPWVATTEHRDEQGEPIRVGWFGAPGNRYDWLSLIRGCFAPEAWPLRPGRYAVGLCVDDDYDCIATSEVFRIVASQRR
jgi:hypothetical protein